jgi:large subunit GTPase 1
MRSAGEMLCAGILPINHMRDYIEPGNVIASRVPMHLLDAAYGMKIKRELDFKDNPNRPPNAHEMLYAYCAIKGFITNGTGRWDEFRACKEMLRDFADGRILYVSPPQNEKDMERWLADTEKTMLKREKVAERIALQKLQEVDDNIAEVEAESEMVFGDWTKREVIRETDDDADELASNLSDFSLDDGTATAAESTKREHKRLKHWGKKNKKLRDKDPYGDKETGYVSYTAFTTNRTQGTGSLDKISRVRQSNRTAYGKAFVRPVLPGNPLVNNYDDDDHR